MRFRNVFATGCLAGGAAAQLLVGPGLMKLHGNAAAGTAPSSFIHISEDEGQRRLGSAQPLENAQKHIPPYEAGRFTVRPQDNTTCATHGEKQWTGTIDVTDSRRLFFWHFESRNDPENDPIIIWMNGGPGGSSMLGLFTEMGPCLMNPGANVTTANAYAWNNNASLVFLDQPAGVGFSTLADGAPLPHTDLDGAQDFQVFLNIFFSEVFPHKAHLPIHIAGESYGGHYAPTYVNHILDSRRHDSRTAFWGNITSLILVDAMIDWTGPAVGAYEMMCSDYEAEPLYNETVCESIRVRLPETEWLGRMCDLSYDGRECSSMMEYSQSMIHWYYVEEVIAGKRSFYNVNKPCVGMLCVGPVVDTLTAYLNKESVKKALGFPSRFAYEVASYDINQAYIGGYTPLKPMNREVAAVLDAYRTPGLGDIKILVLQGNDDYIVNTPGNKWVYDNLRWSGQAEYRMRRWAPLPEMEAETDTETGVTTTGVWKATRDGRLAFVAVDGAGHMVPGDKPEGAYRILQRWFEGGWHA